MSISRVQAVGALTTSANVNATMPAWSPAPTAGDLMVLVINAYSASTLRTVSLTNLTSAGWTLVSGSPFQYNSTKCSVAILWKIAGASEGTTIQVATCGATTAWDVYAYTFRSTTGFPTKPLDQSAHSATSTSTVTSKATGVTGVLGRADSLALSFVGLAAVQATTPTVSGGGFSTTDLPATKDNGLTVGWYETAATTALTTTTWAWAAGTAEQACAWTVTFVANPVATLWSAAVNALGAQPTIWYRMDSANATEFDQGAAGDNGTIGSALTKGATSLVVGDADKAITFPGTNPGASTGAVTTATDATNLEPSTVLSFAALINATSIPGNGVIIALGTDASGTWVYGFALKANGNLDFFVNNNSTPAGDLTTASVSTGATHFIVATWDGTTMKIYVDGVQNPTTVAFSTAQVYGTAILLAVGGAGPTASSFYGSVAGVVDEFLFCNGHALTPAEVTALYNGSIGLTTQTLAASTTPAGAFAKLVQKTLVAASFAPAGALVRFTQKVLAGANETASAALASIKTGGGGPHNYTQTLTAAMVNTGSAVRQPRRTLVAAALGLSGAFNRLTTRTLVAATLTPAAAFVRQARKTLTAALAPSGTARRAITEVLTAAFAPAGALRRLTTYPLVAAALTVAGNVLGRKTTPPVFVRTNTATTVTTPGSTQSSITLPYAAAASGDTLFAIVLAACLSSTQTCTGPGGNWTAVAQLFHATDGLGDYFDGWLFQNTAADGSTSATFAFGSNTTPFGVVEEFAHTIGIDLGHIFSDSSTAGTALTGAGTAADTNDWQLLIAVLFDSAFTVSTAPSGYTEDLSLADHGDGGAFSFGGSAAIFHANAVDTSATVVERTITWDTPSSPSGAQAYGYTLLARPGLAAYLQTLTAALAPAGLAVRRITAPLAASFTAGGIVLFTFARVLAAMLTPTATLASSFAKLTSVVFTAAFAPSGALNRRSSRAFAATATPTAALSRRITKTVTAAFASAPTLVRSTGVVLVATLGSSGAVLRSIGAQLIASLTSSALVKRVVTVVLGGAETPSAALTRRTTFLLTAATEGVSGALAASKTFLRTLVAATLGPSGTFAKQAQVVRAASLAPAGTLRRAVMALRTATFAPTGIVNRAIKALFVAAGLTPTGALGGTRTYVRTLVAATFTASGGLVRQVQAARSASLTASGALRRTIVVPLVAAVIAPAATLVRLTRRMLAATETVSAAFTSSRLYVRVLAPAALGLQGTVTRAVSATLTASTAAQGAFQRTTAAMLSATVVPTASLARSALMQFVATIAPAGSVQRQVARSFAAALAEVSEFAGGRGSKFFVNFTATLAPSGSLRRSIGAVFTAVIALLGNLFAKKALRGFEVTYVLTRVSEQSYSITSTPVEVLDWLTWDTEIVYALSTPTLEYDMPLMGAVEMAYALGNP